MSKLYPPIISEKLPAFTIGENSATITIPFSMNRGVSKSEVWGFMLKLKTVQTGREIATIEKESSNNIFNTKQIEFEWEWENNPPTKYKGQFLKAQIAYIENDNGSKGEVGYYSNVSIIKCTSKPNVYIEEYKNNNNDSQHIFSSICVGKCDLANSDPTEKPYIYKFLLYDENKNIVEDSDWQIYNNNEEDGRIYTFKKGVNPLDKYFVEYRIKTINNLEVSSPQYKCYVPYTTFTNFLDLNVENIFDNGYINLSFSEIEGNTESNFPAIINLYRQEKNSNQQIQTLITSVQFNNITEIENWSFKDFTIEQGVEYEYYFKYSKDGFETQEYGNQFIEADFEDMFLWDGEKQIKLRFNPKISSFKTNQLEQKIETIGSRYPLFFKNGIVKYKEFPISGLISYYLDDNELFINKSDLQLTNVETLERQSTFHSDDDFNNKKTTSTNLLGYNIYAERQFKLKLLDWLGDGKVKLFKSPAEGNYLVKILNISLTPEDKLNRMLHTFQGTAYEVAAFTYDNLIKFNLVNIAFVEESQHNQNLIFAEALYYGKTTITDNSSSFKQVILEQKQQENISNSALINLIDSSNNLLIDSDNNELTVEGPDIVDLDPKKIYYYNNKYYYCNADKRLLFEQDKKNNLVIINHNEEINMDNIQIKKIFGEINSIELPNNIYCTVITQQQTNNGETGG